MQSYTIVPMAATHVPQVAALEKQCFGAHWTPTNFYKELDNERCHYYVTLDADRVLGYLGYWQILEEAHITAVGVEPDYRQQKLAQRMLCYMLDRCTESEIQWITLEVKASNIAAQKLYEKFNFAVMGRRKNYYQAEKEDALIMWTEKITDPQYQAVLAQQKKECNYVPERSAS